MASSTGTPESGTHGEDGTSQTKTSTAKDRQCQYCGQAFTSSSLGRHLDQFIYKKKPDGIHNVDEIKDIRAGITRRQARSSNVKQDGDTEEGTEARQSQPHDQVPIAIPFVDKYPASGHRTYLNIPNWQTTGVINGLPGSGPVSAVSLAPLNLKRPATVLESPIRSEGSEKDTVRALELALREVLENVQAASARSAAPTAPFDFNFQEQSYPSLCLLLLPPPPMLLSSIPFSTPGTLPLEPPGPQHLEPLRSRIQSLIDQWRSTNLANASAPQNPHDLSKTVLGSMQQHSQMARQHLELAYHNWAQLSKEAKEQQWRLELMRAYVSELDRRNGMAEQVDKAEQEVRRLQAQVDMLSRCQWPREFALFPPEARPFSRDVSQTLQSIASHARPSSPSADQYWDFDNLVQKWKRVVSEDSARTLNASARLPLAPPHSASPTTVTASDAARMTPGYQKPSSAPLTHTPTSKKPRMLNGSMSDGAIDRRPASQGGTDTASFRSNAEHPSTRTPTHGANDNS